MMVLVTRTAARRRWRPLSAASFVQPTCVLSSPPQAQLSSARDTFASSRREQGTLNRTIAGAPDMPGPPRTCFAEPFGAWPRAAAGLLTRVTGGRPWRTRGDIAWSPSCLSALLRHGGCLSLALDVPDAVFVLSG